MKLNFILDLRGMERDDAYCCIQDMRGLFKPGNLCQILNESPLKNGCGSIPELRYFTQNFLSFYSLDDNIAIYYVHGEVDDSKTLANLLNIVKDYKCKWYDIGDTDG